MSKAYKVLLTTVMTSFLSIGLMVPFRIYANGSLPAPFVGFNVNLIDVEIDDEYETNISSSGGTYSGSVARHSASVTLEGDFTAIQRTSSGVTYMTTETSVGSVNGVNNATGTITENAASESGTLSLNISSSSTYHYDEAALMEFEIILDSNYIGYFNVSLKSGSTTLQSRTIYVNGNSASCTWSVLGSFSNSLSNYSITINSFDLMLDVEGMWNFPIESYNFVRYFIGLGKSPVQFYMNSYYTFPIFELNNGDQIWRSSMGSGQSQIVIFGIDKYITASNFDSYFTIPAGFSAQYENIGLIPLSTSSYGRIVKYTFTNNNESSQSLILNYIGSSTKITPIYSRNSTEKFISTDFALQFGLRNELLDELGILANGTTGSNQSANNVTNESSNLTDVSDDIHSMESTFNNDLNNNLQVIDTTVTPGTFGSSFLASSSWVKTQFDQLTSNTPFGSVLSFSLVLGLGLLIVGRALK